MNDQRTSLRLLSRKRSTHEQALTRLALLHRDDAIVRLEHRHSRCVFRLSAALGIGFTLATTTDIFTLTSGASGQDRVCESTISGEATASAVNRVAFQRSTGGATPTNQTPEKLNTRSPAAASTTATTWTTQPTLSGNAAFFHAFNAFGGSDRWVPGPRQA